MNHRDSESTEVLWHGLPTAPRQSSLCELCASVVKKPLRKNDESPTNQRPGVTLHVPVHAERAAGAGDVFWPVMDLLVWGYLSRYLQQAYTQNSPRQPCRLSPRLASSFSVP